eukprot:gene625-339_t
MAKDARAARRLIHKLGGKMPVKSKLAKKILNKSIKKKNMLAGKKNAEHDKWGGFTRHETKVDPGNTMPIPNLDKIMKKKKKPETGDNVNQKEQKPVAKKRKFDAVQNSEHHESKRIESQKHFESLSKSQQRKSLSEQKMKRRRVHYDLERATAKMYGNLLQTTKAGWNPQTIIREILDTVGESQMSMKNYALTKIGSRVLQACVKYGTPQQLLEIADVCRENFKDILLGKFSHLLLIKVYSYLSKASIKKDKLVKNQENAKRMFLILVKLLSNKDLTKSFGTRFGCHVVNSIYYNEHLPKSEKRRLFNEITIPAMFALQTEKYSKDLDKKSVWALVNDKENEKKHKSVLVHLAAVCSRAVDKETLSFGLVQEVFELFCAQCSLDQLQDITSRCIEGAPHFLASKAGANALVRILGVASPKNRKSFIKALKGQYVAIAKNKVTCVVLWRLLTTVDDTVLLIKSVLPELISELTDLVSDEAGSKTLLLLTSGLTAMKSFLSEEDFNSLNIDAPSSKKDRELREKELATEFVSKPLKQLFKNSNLLELLGKKYSKDVVIAATKKNDEVFKTISDELKSADNLKLVHTSKFCTRSLLKIVRDSEASRKFIAEGLVAQADKHLKTAVCFVFAELASCGDAEVEKLVKGAVNADDLVKLIKQGEKKNAEEKMKAPRKLLEVLDKSKSKKL